MHFSIRLRVA